MSNTYEMTGKVKVLFAPMNFASGFTKRQFGTGGRGYAVVRTRHSRG
jgi:hypothetical protein